MGIFDWLVGKKPKAPKTPDPIQVAGQQGEANLDTARQQTELNRYNETNPFGSQSWETDPNNPNSYTLNTTYDPRIMEGVNKSIENTNTGLGLQGQGLGLQGRELEQQGKILDQQGRNLDLENKMTGYTSQLADRTAGILANESRHAPTLETAMNYANMANDRLYDPNANVEGAYGAAGSGNKLLGNTIDSFNKTQSKDFNYNQAPRMPTADEQTRQKVADAMYGRAASRLDPRFEQAQSDMDAKLAAQGITQGSAAYDREMQNLGRERTDAYQAAQNEAETGSGNTLAQIFNMGLGARQQGVGEANTIRDQESREALVASQLAGGANQSANQGLATAIERGRAIPDIAQGMFDLDRSAFDAGNEERNQALRELNTVSGMSGGSGSGAGQYSSNIASGNQPFMPQFSSGQGGGAAIGQTPIADSAYNSYTGEMNKYNTKVGSRNNNIAGITGIVSNLTSNAKKTL